MKIYITKNEKASGASVALDDMFLTKELPTTAGSKMLDGYVSLFGADVADRLAAAGIAVSGKTNVGEFGIDLLGETSYFGACTDEKGNLTLASAEAVKSGEAKAALAFDVNGAPRRGAALSGLTYVKPTYGTVSRYGTIPAACSGECVGVMANTADDCEDILDVIAGHDDKDGTSLPEEKCTLLKKSAPAGEIKSIAVIKNIADTASADTKAVLEAAKAVFEKNGVSVTEIECDVMAAAKTAWGVLMCAELCNNVSRYDGVKYGHRSSDYKTIGELYTNSRTEAFGELAKTAILYGSEVLSDDNYMPVYDKSLRVRRVICEAYASIFEKFDAVLLPACEKTAYTEADIAANKYISFDEALYTAPASITGLPAVVSGGVQLIGKAFSEKALLSAAKLMEKEGK